ncbi:hypothetical protein KIN20_026158 [Parelaphostrongylus tenuis]|uniref:Uncharacterized protein n=1 Tax=Parelaphostrongylus tenuis TaxID=148309 RepID=A0AAD5NA08_PARTN|nr:hypothetical protein KIN20_026158 [Parelaphostrongylus tenuis]
MTKRSRSATSSPITTFPNDKEVSWAVQISTNPEKAPVTIDKRTEGTMDLCLSRTPGEKSSVAVATS